MMGSKGYEALMELLVAWRAVTDSVPRGVINTHARTNVP